MNTYLLVFNDGQIARKTVTARIDRMPQVINWMAFLDNALCLISDETTKSLAAQLREAFPETQFILTELQRGKRNGWLPRSVWDFMNDPRPASAESQSA
jgi:hypothetical protein